MHGRSRFDGIRSHANCQSKLRGRLYNSFAIELNIVSSRDRVVSLAARKRGSGGAEELFPMSGKTKRVCVDVGGTFTDCLVMDETGLLQKFKSSTTPRDPSKGFMDAMKRRRAITA